MTILGLTLKCSIIFGFERNGLLRHGSVQSLYRANTTHGIELMWPVQNPISVSTRSIGQLRTFPTFTNQSLDRHFSSFKNELRHLYGR